jgi:hypothetical protein
MASLLFGVLLLDAALPSFARLFLALDTGVDRTWNPKKESCVKPQHSKARLFDDYCSVPGPMREGGTG